MGAIPKAIVFCAGLLVGAALMFIFAKTTMEMEAGSNVEPFSKFIERIDVETLKEVTYAGGEEISYVTTDGKRFVTTAPPAAFAYEGLTQKLLERGVVVKATRPR